MQKTLPKKHGNSWNLNHKSSRNRGRNVSKSLISLYSSFSENNDYRWSVCKKNKVCPPGNRAEGGKRKRKIMEKTVPRKWCKNERKIIQKWLQNGIKKLPQNDSKNDIKMTPKKSHFNEQKFALESTSKVTENRDQKMIQKMIKKWSKKWLQKNDPKKLTF